MLKHWAENPSWVERALLILPVTHFCASVLVTQHSREPLDLSIAHLALPTCREMRDSLDKLEKVLSVLLVI